MSSVVTGEAPMPQAEEYLRRKKTKNIKTIIGTNRIAQTKITKVRSSYVTRVSCHGPTELEQVLGTGMNVVHNSHKNLHKFRVRV